MAFSVTGTITIADVRDGADGAPGADANFYKNVYLYAQGTSAPTAPANNTGFNTTTGEASAVTGWATSISSVSSGNTIWIANARLVQTEGTGSWSNDSGWAVNAAGYKGTDGADGADGVDGTNGTNGTDGSDAPRFAERKLYTNPAVSTAPSAPSATITWSTGALSSITSGWSETPPTHVATSSDSIYESTLVFIDTSPPFSTTTTTGSSPRVGISFSGLVTFDAGDFAVDGTTITNIDGGNIQTGTITATTLVSTIRTDIGAGTGNSNLTNANVSIGGTQITSGTVSTARLPTDVSLLGNSGALFTNTTTINGGQITTGSISTQYLDVDTALNLNAPAASLLAGRTSSSDFGTDGFYIGRTSTTGNAADGFQLSHTSLTTSNTVGASGNLLADGTVQGVIHDDTAGLRIYEPIFYQRSSGGNGNVILSNNSAATTLAAGEIHYVTISGGGGGGGGGRAGDANNQNGTVNAGGTGGTTTVVLTGATGYNGTRTFNAAGGAGGTAGGWEANGVSENQSPSLRAGLPGANSQWGSGGLGSTSVAYQQSNPGGTPAANSYGAGGGGGAGYASESGTGLGGGGGHAGAVATVTIDLTNASTDGTLTLNAVGIGGNAGTPNVSNSTATPNAGGTGQQGVAVVSGVLDGYDAFTLANVGGASLPWHDEANAGNGTTISNSSAGNNTWATVISGSANVGRYVQGGFRRQSTSLSTAPSIGIGGTGTGSWLVATGAGGGQGANIYSQDGGLVATNKTNYAFTCQQQSNSYMNTGYFYGYIAPGDNITARRTFVTIRQWDE